MMRFQVTQSHTTDIDVDDDDDKDIDITISNDEDINISISKLVLLCDEVYRESEQLTVEIKNMLYLHKYCNLINKSDYDRKIDHLKKITKINSESLEIQTEGMLAYIANRTIELIKRFIKYMKEKIPYLRNFFKKISIDNKKAIEDLNNFNDRAFVANYADLNEFSLSYEANKAKTLSPLYDLKLPKHTTSVKISKRNIQLGNMLNYLDALGALTDWLNDNNILINMGDFKAKLLEDKEINLAIETLIGLKIHYEESDVRSNKPKMFQIMEGTFEHKFENVSVRDKKYPAKVYELLTNKRVIIINLEKLNNWVLDTHKNIQLLEKQVSEMEIKLNSIQNLRTDDPTRNSLIVYLESMKSQIDFGLKVMERFVLVIKFYLIQIRKCFLVGALS